MRTIERSSAFKRDYRREVRGRLGATLDAVLLPVLSALAGNEFLEPRRRDHDLLGDWAGYRGATSSPICCSSTDCPTPKPSGWLGLAPTVNSSANLAAAHRSALRTG